MAAFHDTYVCGCLYTLPSGREVSLPLHSVSVQVNIADVLARVTLTQYFANPNRTDVPTQARYVFPVPAGGAVCGFEMHTADGKTIVGRVKEAVQAEREFKEALAKNKTAGLLAKAAPDVFTMSLGAIPPRQSIKTIVTYVVELADDELSNQVRFSLPTYVGGRYGKPPTAILVQDTPIQYAQFTLTAEVQMTSPIEQVNSSSHAINTIMRTDGGPAFRCSVDLDASAGAVLDKDFILSVKAGKLDNPRCVAEVIPQQDSVALSLTLVPRFGVKPIPSQEYIFLIDRSGSMGGESKIEYAKKALLIMLKSLPTAGTTFNIFSFGSTYSPLWPASQPYSQASLTAAVLYVESMGADMGGTELASALHGLLESRTPTMPTSVFVLTDGKVWRIDPIVSELSARVAAAGDSSYLRVFTLGVGHSASSALCSSLARSGNGLCLMTTQSEELVGKCARLLRASRVPPSGNLKNVCIDWGYAAAETSTRSSNMGGQPGPQTPGPTLPASAVSLFDEAHDPLAPSGLTGLRGDGDIAQLAADVIQAPSVVPDFYPGNRFIISAILNRIQRAPEHVVLRGETPDGTPIELRVPVHVIDFPGTRRPLVHTLAARKIIQELEDGYVQCLGLNPNGTAEGTKAVARGAAVLYSIQYQLASKYASFIAVENKEDKSAELSDDFGFEMLNESDIDVDEWADDFELENKPELQEAGANEGPAHIYVPTFTGYSRAKHETEQSKAQARLDNMSERHLPLQLLAGAQAIRSQGIGSTPQQQTWVGGPYATQDAYRAAPMGMQTVGGGSSGFGAPRDYGMSPPAGLVPQSYFASLPRLSSVPPSPAVAAQFAEGDAASDSESDSEFLVGGSAADTDIDLLQEGQSHARLAPQSETCSIDLVQCGLPPRQAHSPLARYAEPDLAPEDDPVTAIARLQNFDGAFELDDALCRLVFDDKTTVESLRDGIPAYLSSRFEAERIWAAAIAVAYLKTKAGELMDVWVGLWEKANHYAAEALAGSAVSFDQVVADAEKVL